MKQCAFFVLLCGVIASARASAQSLIPINTQAVRRAVVFLYGADSAGKPDVSKELATGFLVQIPFNGDAAQSYFILVTARHVVDPVWACAATQNPTVLYARVNHKVSTKPQSSQVDFIKLSLVENNRQSWAKHVSDAVDAAVLPIDAAAFFANDVVPIRVADFGTPEEIKSVGIGDDIVSAGLVPGLSGKKKNNPFFKFGRISNIPDEDGLLPCGTTGKPGIYWYIAATLIGGNSGSPIFLLPPGNAIMSFGNTRPFLLGLQSMSIVAGEIAGMVPVQYIFEIIESLKLPDANLRRGPVAKNSPPAPQKR